MSDWERYEGMLIHISQDLTVTETFNLGRFGEIISREGDLVKLRIPKAETPQITARILTELQVDDLTVEDPPIESVIEEVFSQKSL